MADILEKAGHKVFVPTLKGLGGRVNEASSSVGLTDHVKDIVGLLESKNLSEVFLVGHSYGGMVITAVADCVPERLGRLIYLDAFVPEDGQSLTDLGTEETHARFLQLAKESGQGWRIPSPPATKFGITDYDQQEYVNARLTPQPIKTFEEKIKLDGRQGHRVPRSFIYCNNPPMGPFGKFADMAKAAPAWDYHEIEACHDGMITEPVKLANILKVITSIYILVG